MTWNPDAPWGAIISNAVIAATYGGFAVLILWAIARGGLTGWVVTGLKISTLAFFALCAATHVELAAHAYLNIPIDEEHMRSYHFAAIHVLQAVASPSALLFAVLVTRRAMSGPSAEEPLP